MAEEEIDLDANLDEVGDAPEGNVTQPKPLTSFFQGNQRFVIVGGAVFLVILIGLSLFFLRSGPANQIKKSNNLMVDVDSKKTETKKKKKIKYERMFGALTGSEASKIVKELTISDISFKTEQTGRNFSVLVDEDQIDEARNMLAMKGLPAGETKTGYELLDDAQTLGVTEFDKRIRFLRALSGELEKAIVQFDMVESAKVQIVLPEQRLFTVTQPPVTTSVLLRRRYGYELTDDVVYSVIQLVANSVENLQAENISVIDTEGNLLSDGIFERIAEKRARGEIVEEEPTGVIGREEAVGYPIIPDYAYIQEWFELKYNYEKELEEKIMTQLMGIMPLGAFKVAVTSEIGALENGNIVDIKRLGISIVVNGLNDDIFVDQAFKQQIFSTVAGAANYVRGRDTIQLSVAEFPIFTDAQIKELKKKYAQFNLTDILIWTLLGIFIVTLGVFSYRILLSINTKKDQISTEKVNDDDQVDEISPPLNNEEKVTRLQELSSSEPDIVASVIESFLNNSKDSQTENFELETMEAK